MPKRIQRKRTKGWRMPENAVYVGRPTKWGNPFNWQDIEECYSDQEKKQFALDDYQDWLDNKFDDNYLPHKRINILNNIAQLEGKDLACWCPLDKPCHADVLLRLANPTCTGTAFAGSDSP